MKKMLVALMAICIAFTSLSFTVLAEEATGDANTPETGDAVVQETKTVESLVGAFYLQGESGNGYLGDNTVFQSDYDYTVSDVFAKALKGTAKVPFYAFDKDGEVYFDSFAEDYLISEANAAKAAGIDFFAYKFYCGYTNSTSNPIRNMNNQLIRHTSIFSNSEFTSGLKYALVIDGDVLSSKSKEVNMIVDRFLIMKGYLTAEDGRPVVFIEWHDDVKAQIEKINKRLAKVVADGANPKKSTPKTQLNDDVEAMYVVALNAPSLSAATAAGCDAVSWTEGSGKNGEAYANMVANVEAKWSSESENVVPNVVTGFDKTPLAANPIEIVGKKYDTDKTTSERYKRSGAADESVAPATAAELVEHIKKAVATTNKPTGFKAVMVYAWDDFMGGAYLAPTKTDKAYQYNTDYLNAMREYFYGKTDGMPEIKVLDNANNTVVTDSRNKTITTLNKDNEVISKVDFDGKDLLAPATTDDAGDQATPTATANTNDGNTDDNGEGGMNTTYIIIGAVAAVVIIAVVVVVVIVSKKKKSN